MAVGEHREPHRITFADVAAHVAVIRVNGKTVATLTRPGYEAIIPAETLRPGANLLEIDLVTSLRNMLGPHHLEEGESLLDAVVRETLEETAYHFKPTHLVGIYTWQHPTKKLTYLRFAFGGELRGYEADRPLDEGIIAARWLTLDEVKAPQARHRSPLILRGIEDMLAGQTCPLDLLVHYG